MNKEEEKPVFIVENLITEKKLMTETEMPNGIVRIIDSENEPNLRDLIIVKSENSSDNDPEQEIIKNFPKDEEIILERKIPMQKKEYEISYEVEIDSPRNKSLPRMIRCYLAIKNYKVSILYKDVELEWKSILFSDLLGASVIDDDNNGKCPLGKSQVLIYYFPYNNASGCCKMRGYHNAPQRKIKSVVISVQKNIASDILSTLNSIGLYSCFIEQGGVLIQRKFTVIINPTSGNGKSLKKWEKCKKIFECSYVILNVVQTKGKGDAYNHILHMQYQCDGVICISGDGTVHEVINAILHRSDEYLKSVPIGIVPSGKMNGLAKSISVLSLEKFTPEVFAYTAFKYHCRMMDVLEIKLPNQEKMTYSFHSFSWGFCSESRLHPDGLNKWLGSVGKNLTKYWRIINLNSKRFYGNLIYVYQDNEKNEKYMQMEGEFRSILAANLPWLSKRISTGKKTFDEGHIDLYITKGGRKSVLDFSNRKSLPGCNFNETSQSGTLHVKAKSLKLFPEDKMKGANANSVYSIDGEEYPLQPIEIKVIPKCLKIFCMD